MSSKTPENLFEDSDDELATPTFNSRPQTCGVLAFHNGTEEALLLYVEKNSMKGDVNSIIKAVDTFCYTRHWMMHIGDKKSIYLQKTVKKVVTSCVNSNRAEICVELGSYCGYSALKIASLLSENGHLFCIEKQTKCVEWTSRMLTHANLLHKVTIIHGIVDDNTIVSLKEEINNHLLNIKIATNMKPPTIPPTIDLLFIDHEKNMYLYDLQFLISASLFHTGSMVIADNVLCFDDPLHEYMEYVKDPNGPFYNSETIISELEYSSDPCQQHQQQQQQQQNDTSLIIPTTSQLNKDSNNDSSDSVSHEHESQKDNNTKHIDGLEISIYK